VPKLKNKKNFVFLFKNNKLLKLTNKGFYEKIFVAAVILRGLRHVVDGEKEEA